jgi:hypothetical protein
MDFTKILPLESILKNESLRGKICSVVVSTIIKNMGEATDVKLYQERDGSVTVLASNGKEFWKVKAKDFFSIGAPVDITSVFAKMLTGDNIAQGHVLLTKVYEGIALSVFEKVGDGISTLTFSGDLWQSCNDFILKNAGEISKQGFAKVSQVSGMSEIE